LNLTFSNSDNRAGNRKVFLNGKVLRGAVARIHEQSTLDSRVIPKFIGVTFKGSSVNAIRPFTIFELLNHVNHFNVATSFSDFGKSDSWGFAPFMIGTDLSHKLSDCSVFINVVFDAEHWNKPYSIADLAFHIHQSLNKTKRPFTFQAASKGSLTEGFGLYTSFRTETSISEVIGQLRLDLQAVRSATRLALEPSQSNAVIAKFDFPTDVRAACEQYLLYFGQFLRDLGIEADTKLSEQASNVLFTVTPANRLQALDSIREALNCYLQMPGSPEAMSSLEASQDVAAMQLQSNILHLKSQLHLAAAVIQAKDATINAHQAEMASIRQSVDLRNYLPDRSQPDSDHKETLIEGVVSVKKFDYKGLEFDLPSIVRRLKRYISG
jgi:hypothetical protein